MVENETKKSGLATASLVLGIIGACTSFIPIVNNISFILGALAIIFAIVAFIKKAGKGKLIAGLILGILAIVITINMQKAVADALKEVSSGLDKATGGQTEQVLKNELDVELGNFELDNSEFLQNTKLPVKVKNKSSETKSFSIKIEAIDSEGTRIQEDIIYANSLKADQSQLLEAFTLVSTDNSEKLKNATFKILEVSSY